MELSFSTQLSAADISERENSSVTKGPVVVAVVLAGAAPVRSPCAGPPATAPVVGTSATAAAAATALSRHARLLPACFLSRSAVIMVTSSFMFPVAVAAGYGCGIARYRAAPR